MAMLEADDPPAVTVVNESGRSRYVLLCEHASNFIPTRYRKLGLPDHDIQRHIAYDIGAAGVALKLSAMLDAPLVLSGYSRLLIDCNRPIGAPTSIPTISETTDIPGNIGLDVSERARRAELFWQPFQRTVSAMLDRRQHAKMPTIVFGVHSFTPVFKGFVRPWHAGVLFRKSETLSLRLLEALREPGLAVAANEPYQIMDDHDHTVPVHGEQRGLEALLIELRQDLIGHNAGQTAWSERLARTMRDVG